ncbi:hypothetical protein BH11ACT3_BH11ACT3_12440 [soil metagenome]
MQSLRLSLEKPATATQGDDALPIRRGVVTTRDISFDPSSGAASSLRPSDESVLQTKAIELPVEGVSTGSRTGEGASTRGRPRVRPLMPRPNVAPVLGSKRTVDLASMMNPPAWTLQLPDGSEFEVTTPAVVGRRPWRTTPDETTTFYVVAPSPKREISGVHLEVAIVGDELQARDLNSTNGTLVLTASRSPRLLHGGRSTTLRTGDILDLGESFRISVGTRPAR